MTVQIGAIEDWIRRYGATADDLIKTLNILSLQAENQQDFTVMRKLQEYAYALEHLMIAAGRRRKADPLLIEGIHPIERRALRHISVVGGQHWKWNGSTSVDGVPLISVPKGWPSPGVPRYDASTGTTVVDGSYAPPERLNHTNHTTMAVYRALWFTHYCNPRSPAFDPQRQLLSRQKLMKMCTYENCVNPQHYEKVVAAAGLTPLRRRSPQEVRALLPPYATETAVSHVDKLLQAGSAQYCRRGHQYEFDPTTGFKLRCAKCQAINNDNRVKKRQQAHQALLQQAKQQFPEGVASAYSYDPITNELHYDPEKDPTFLDNLAEAEEFVKTLPTAPIEDYPDLAAVLQRAAQKYPHNSAESSAAHSCDVPECDGGGEYCTHTSVAPPTGGSEETDSEPQPEFRTAQEPFDAEAAYAELERMLKQTE